MGGVALIVDVSGRRSPKVPLRMCFRPVRLFVRSFVCSFVRSFVRSFVCSFRSFVSFVRSFLRFVRSFVSFVCSFACSFVRVSFVPSFVSFRRSFGLKLVGNTRSPRSARRIGQLPSSALRVPRILEPAA